MPQRQREGRGLEETCREKMLAARIDAVSGVVEFALLGLRTQLLVCLELLDRNQAEQARELLLEQIKALQVGECTDTVQ